MAVWLPLTQAATGLFTVVNFVDKHVVEREVQAPRALAIFPGLEGAIASLMLFLLGAWTPMPLLIVVGVWLVIG